MMTTVAQKAKKYKKTEDRTENSYLTHILRSGHNYNVVSFYCVT